MMEKANVASLHDAQLPTSRTQLRPFLGLWNIYRHFIDYFTQLTHQLNKLIKKGEPDFFKIDNKQRKSFDSLINTFCSPSVLGLPRDDLLYSLG